MGDMADDFRAFREHRQKQVATGERVSMQYRTEKDRERGVAFKHKAQQDFDCWTAERLDKLGIQYERKGAASFQITVNGRVGMYYDGKKGEQIRWNDGEVEHGNISDLLKGDKE